MAPDAYTITFGGKAQMAGKAGDRGTQGEWNILNGGAVAAGVSGSSAGHLGHNEGVGPGGWQAHEYWEEMKDMLNDALGG